ncbi:MAG: 50S ribosomal protein L18 [Deltaproteobacteria bacterium]|nr:50S ribosomal protein L18 [Deltaproteobacteria bacterium]
MSTKDSSRIRRKRAIRKRLSGTAERPRLSVFRSAKHVYAQVVDDVARKTLLEVSSLSKALAEAGGKKLAVAAKVGELVAKVCAEKKITTVAFDRNGYLFHGRIKAIADGARKAGLKF